MTVQLVIGVLLACLGVLVGASWTVQALQPKLRRQAEERRRLNEEWSFVRAARNQRNECPNCRCSLYEGNWYIAPTVVEEEPYDD